MTVKQYLADFKKKFAPKMGAFLAQKEKQAKSLTPEYTQAIWEIKRLVKAGGKRLRPAFVYTAFKACEGQGQKVWPACLTVELIQTFALIHDDIIDHSFLRRGQPTCFKKMGPEKAILVGDLALVLADELITHQEKKYFNLLKLELLAGQYLDIFDTQNKNLELEEKRILKTMELKTSCYTTIRPLQIGACLAGAKKQVLDTFFNYGQKLGLAFQIQDDILGIFGQEKKTGKPVGIDIEEGKKTLLTIKLLKKFKKLNDEQSLKKFKTIFGKKGLAKKDLEWLKQKMIKLKVLAECQQKITQLTNQAKRTIKDLQIRKKEKDFLLGVCDYVIRRQS